MTRDRNLFARYLIAGIAFVAGGGLIATMFALRNWGIRVRRLELMSDDMAGFAAYMTRFSGGHQDILANHETRLQRLGSPGQEVLSSQELEARAVAVQRQREAEYNGG